MIGGLLPDQHCLVGFFRLDQEADEIIGIAFLEGLTVLNERSPDLKGGAGFLFHLGQFVLYLRW